MTFNELWKQVKGLPEAAEGQVPDALSEAIKNELTKKNPSEVAAIVMAAIDEVNQGSIEPLNILIKKRL